MKFTKALKGEAERHTREGLSEDELELFDLLKKDSMTKDETQKVKLAAKALLHRLREEAPPVLVQDWFKDVQTQKVVRSAVETVLDANLPNTYDRVLFRKKCDNVLEMMLELRVARTKMGSMIPRAEPAIYSRGALAALQGGLAVASCSPACIPAGMRCICCGPAWHCG